MSEKPEPVTGVAGEDIRKGDKICLTADGLWYRKHAVREPQAQSKLKTLPKRKR